MTTEHDILDVISSLRARIKEIEGSIREPLAKVRRDLEAAERTLELVREVKGAQIPLFPSVRASELVGMTQIEALRTIAKRNEGIVVVQEARRLVKQAGLSKSKSVSQIIRAAMLRSPDFEFLGSGRFRLVPHTNGQQPTIPNKEGVQDAVPTVGH